MLASEVLLEEVAPSAPGMGAERVTAAVVGLLGLALEVGASRATDRPVSWLLVAAFASLLVVGLAPLPYGARAGAVFVVGGAIGTVTLVTTAAGDWMRTAAAALLSALVVVLPAGLLVRSNYCGAKTGRAVTALGLVVLIGWLALQGAQGVFGGFDGRAGAPGAGLATAAVALALVGFLALLAFMGPGSTGGCRVWAIALLVWTVGQLALEGWAEAAGNTTHGSSLLLWHLSSRVSATLLLVPAAVALSHLLGAGISERTREQAERATKRREAVVRDAKRSVLEMRRARADSEPVERRKTG